MRISCSTHLAVLMGTEKLRPCVRERGEGGAEGKGSWVAHRETEALCV